MATITYKCNLCDREIDLLENKQGLSSFSKCVITSGCRGKLIKIKRNINNIREKFPAEVSGLQDYTPRKLLYNHTQSINTKTWKIIHNLENNPAVMVYVYDANGDLIRANKDSYKVSFIDNNTLILTFNQSQIGVAQLVVRTTYMTTPKTITVATDFIQATVGGNFVFSIPKYLTNFLYPPTVTPTPPLPYDLKNATIRFQVELKKPNEDAEICDETFSFNLLDTSWIGWTQVIMRKRKNYYLIAKNILDFKTLSLQNPNFSDIPNGTTLKFTGVDYGTGVFQPIEPDMVFGMLTNYPYTVNDKNKDKSIDIGEMIKNNYDYFIYQDSEFYVHPSVVNTIYPNIMRVA